MSINHHSRLIKRAVIAMLVLCLGMAGCGISGGNSNNRYKGKEISGPKSYRHAPKKINEPASLDIYQQLRQTHGDPISEVIEQEGRLNDPLPAR